MFKRISIIIISIAMLSIFQIQSLAFGHSDTEGHWAEIYTDFVHDRGIIVSTGPTYFSPDNYFTRGDLAKAIAKCFNVPYTYNVNTGFSDVPSTSSNACYIKWCKDSGIVNGTTPTTFNPGGYVTREQICCAFYRTANILSSLFFPNLRSAPYFYDDSSISIWARDAVYQFYRSKIISGYDDGRFAPGDYITRAGAAKVAYYYYSLKNYTINGVSVYLSGQSGIMYYVKDYDDNTAVSGIKAYAYPNNPQGLSDVYPLSDYGTSGSDGVGKIISLNISPSKIYALNTFKSGYEQSFSQTSTEPSYLMVPIKVRTSSSFFNINSPITNYSPSSSWSSTYTYLTSCQNFGWRYMNNSSNVAYLDFHQGVDISKNVKTSTPVKNAFATTSTVVTSREISNAGNVVQVKIGGYEDCYATYMHLSSRSVSTGALVSPDQTLGYAGNTGTVGVHLHFSLASVSNLSPNTSSYEEMQKFYDPVRYFS